MTWFRIDDQFHSHPKTLRAGNAAIGLWTRCGSYSAQHLTDGHIPADLVLIYGSVAQATRLEACGLWIPEDGGWIMHDFSFYNPTSDKVRAERKNTAERQRRARQAAQSRRDNGVSHA